MRDPDDNQSALLERIRELEAQLERARARIAAYEEISALADLPMFEWRPFLEEKPWWNPVHFEWLGLDPSTEPSTELWERFVHPDDLEYSRANVVSALQSGADAYQIGFRLCARGQTFKAVSHGQIHRDERGLPVLVRGYLSDISVPYDLQVRRVEDERSRMTGEMAASVTHDLNNILTVVLGGLALVELSEEDREEGLEVAADAARRGGALAGQLLRFLRRRPAVEELVDLDALVNRVGAWIARLLDVRIQLELRTGAARAVYINAARLEQALLNLAMNARDAMPDGGRLQIHTTATEGAAQRWAEITVEDDGHGMSPEVAARAFEPLFTTKPAGRGTGLGLVHCRELLQRAGGGIELHTVEGEGTRFTLTLPAHPLAGAPPRAEVSSSRSRGAVILLVESDGLVRHLNGRYLTSVGHHVLFASDAAQALARARESEAPVDVVVMPSDGRGAGAQLLAALREISASTRALWIDEGAGASPSEAVTLEKPFEPPTLLQRIDALLL